MHEQTCGGSDVHFNREAPWNQVSSTMHPLEGVVCGHRLQFGQVVHITLFKAIVAIGDLQSTAVAVRFRSRARAALAHPQREVLSTHPTGLCGSQSDRLARCLVAPRGSEIESATCRTLSQRTSRALEKAEWPLCLRDCAKKV